MAKRLKAAGVDLIDCSSGGIGGEIAPQIIPLGPGFQTKIAQKVKEQSEILSMAVGLIWEAELANNIISHQQADLVAIGREALNNPNWALHAAYQLGFDDDYSFWKPQFGWWLNKRRRLLKRLGFDI